MANVQTIQCQKAEASFDTVDAAMETHVDDCTALTSVSDYKEWVGTQKFTETYELMSDTSGYTIIRTWGSFGAMTTAETVGTPGNDREQLSVGGWKVEVLTS